VLQDRVSAIDQCVTRDTELAVSEYPVFAVAGRAVTVREIIEAAYLRGEIEPYWRRLIELIEIGKKNSEFQEIDEAVLQAQSEQWRYDRDLITAEEVERWLRDRGLSLEEFSAYFVRNTGKKSIRGGTQPVAIDYLAASRELRDLLRIELLLSGEFDRMAIQLSWRFAASCPKDHVPSHLIEAERACFLELAGLHAGSLPGWLASFGRNQQWLDEMCELEAAFRQQREGLSTPSMRERTLTALRLPLLRLELELIELDSIEAAREAFLCVRDDGAPMEEVARNGRYPYRKAAMFLEDLSTDAQHKVLSAVPGDVLDPINQEDGYQVWHLIRKIEPSLADDEVRHRIERRIIESHFSELAGRHVRWMIPPCAKNDTARR
jgi:hypothetical protein